MGKSDDVQLTMEKSDCKTIWHPMVRCSVFARAQLHASAVITLIQDPWVHAAALIFEPVLGFLQHHYLPQIYLACWIFLVMWPKTQSMLCY